MDDRVAVVTGGAGLLGPMHASAISECGGIPVLMDINAEGAAEKASWVRAETGGRAESIACDITKDDEVRAAITAIEARYGPIKILVNNAANDPKMTGDEDPSETRLENLSLERWANDLAVGLTGAFLCSRAVGAGMARSDGGVILNISSDLGVIAPDQRLYEQAGLPADRQPVKPVTYSVVKHGLVGLTRYLSTYWAAQNVRVNALAPGGVFQDQPEEFLARVTSRIPLGRLAAVDEYMAAVAFLCSDASSYLNGAVMVADGGRSVW
jgi:NAD(P)-dependent dehydrogenase (short-subunit alcohol dehydrogenase family)